MEVELNYGQGSCRVDIPAPWEVTVLRKAPVSTHPDPAAAVRAALGQPVAAAPLREAARGRRSATILICDITRPVPNGLLLPALIDELEAGGIPATAITVLVATGLHRPNEGRELEELVGDPDLLRRVRVVNHYARSDEDHVLIGTTRAGTRVRLDRRFVEADLKIVTGLVEPHFMAGYSGGRKVIAPGIAHEETITTFHSARFMSHPLADNCVLEGNPLHREQLEIVGMLGPVLAVNTLIDEHRRLCFVNYGEILASHAAAVEVARRCTVLDVPRRFDTVLTSAAGYPLDKTYYQTVKGMVAPLSILEPGGNLIIASECSEGLGSEEYVQAQRRLLELGPEGFLNEISGRSHARIDEWQTQMQLRPLAAGQVHLYSGGLDAAAHALTGVRQAPSLEAALESCLARSPQRTIAVIPEGPYLVPRYSGAPAHAA